MSIVRASLKLTGLFEAELLLELMLRYWSHPLADDRDFRNSLLENAAEALRIAAAGQKIIDGLPPRKTNLVAAIWYAEWAELDVTPDPDAENLEGRRKWLEVVRRAVPSCFCDPDQLV